MKPSNPKKFASADTKIRNTIAGSRQASGGMISCTQT